MRFEWRPVRVSRLISALRTVVPASSCEGTVDARLKGDSSGIITSSIVEKNQIAAIRCSIASRHTRGAKQIASDVGRQL